MHSTNQVQTQTINHLMVEAHKANHGNPNKALFIKMNRKIFSDRNLKINFLNF